MPTSRKPLVLDNNKQIQQLQPDELLDAAFTGGDKYIMTTDALGTTICQVVSVVSSGIITLARADSADLVAKARAIGLATETIGSGTAVTIQQAGNFTALTGEWDTITGQTGGLTAGAPYFLSAATEGKLTPTPPATGWVVKLGVAIRNDTLFIDIDPPIKL